GPVTLHATPTPIEDDLTGGVTVNYSSVLRASGRPGSGSARRSALCHNACPRHTRWKNVSESPYRLSFAWRGGREVPLRRPLPAARGKQNRTYECSTARRSSGTFLGFTRTVISRSVSTTQYLFIPASP